MLLAALGRDRAALNDENRTVVTRQLAITSGTLLSGPGYCIHMANCIDAASIGVPPPPPPAVRYGGGSSRGHQEEATDTPRQKQEDAECGGLANSSNQSAPPSAHTASADARGGATAAGLNWQFIRLAGGQIKLMLVYDDDDCIITVEFEEPQVEPQLQIEGGAEPGATGGQADDNSVTKIDSFANLPAEVKQFVTEKWLTNQDTALPALKAAAVDDYFATTSDTRRFHQHLPLPEHLWKKWQQGVRLWPTKNSSFMPYKASNESIAIDIVVARLAAANLIEPARRRPYCSNIFFVPKSTTKVRKSIILT